MKIQKYQPTLSLKPTQFAIGVAEVEYKVDQFLKMKKKALQKEIDENPIPVVISPWKELCVIDHHHFLFSCWHADVREVRVEVVKDFSKNKMSYVKFWEKMARLNYAYLYDQFGDGPRSPVYLPDDIRGMADDPYRSLAWLVRKAGGFEKTDIMFAEFQWADFFRKHCFLHKVGRKGLKQAAERALKIAKSEKAKKLPGYSAGKNSQGKISHVPKAQKKGALATVPKIKDER